MKPNTRYSSGEIAANNWIFPTDANGNIPNDWIHMAAQLATAERLERCANLLQSILSRVDSLGADGIHEVIREAKVTAREREARRRARRRVRRATLRSVKAA